MKNIIISIILFLTALSVVAQCNAITVNSFELKTVGNCKYVIEINASLSNGNASIKPFYSCANVQIELPDCFSWPNPSTQLFVTDTFTCCGTVLAGVRGHASRNCNGNQCIETALTNLPLSITQFNAYLSDDQVCVTWKYEDDNRPDNLYYVEHSFDGQNFQTVDSYTIKELRRTGELSNVCFYDKSLKRYYRLRIVDGAGNTVISAIKTVIPKQNDLTYNTITRQLTIKGEIDDFSPRYLTVYSRDGKEVYLRGITSNITTLPALTPGIYFAVVTSVKGNLIKTIIL